MTNNISAVAGKLEEMTTELDLCKIDLLAFIDSQEFNTPPIVQTGFLSLQTGSKWPQIHLSIEGIGVINNVAVTDITITIATPEHFTVFARGGLHDVFNNVYTNITKLKYDLAKCIKLSKEPQIYV